MLWYDFTAAIISYISPLNYKPFPVA